MDNSDDVIDSRDIIKRVDELESTLQELLDKAKEALPSFEMGFKTFVEEISTTEEHEYNEDAKEFLALTSLADEASNVAEDWTYGATLIKEEHFEDYCTQLVDDIGDMPKLPSYMVIDWEKTTENLKVDYSEVDFDGVTYLIR